MTSWGIPPSQDWVNCYPNPVETVIFLADNSILISSTNKILKSIDSGRTWTILDTLPSKSATIKQILPLDDKGESLLVSALSFGADKGIYLVGIHNKTIRKVLPWSGGGASIWQDSKNKKNIYVAAGSPPTIFHSTNTGKSWNIFAFFSSKEYNTPKTVCSILGIHEKNRLRFILGCDDPGLILCTSDSGKNWQVTYGNNSLKGEVPQLIHRYLTNETFACLSFNSRKKKLGLLRSVNLGISWEEVYSPSNLWALESESDFSKKMYLGQFHKTDTLFPESSVLLYTAESNRFESVGCLSVRNVMALSKSRDNRIIAAATDRGLFLYFI